MRGMNNKDLSAITKYYRYILMKGTYAQQANIVEGIEGKFVLRSQRIELT